MQEERLQKYMARCGVDSRRKCEDLIAQGQVELNGEVMREPGVKIDPARDRIKVNGKLLRQEQPAYFIHYKVKGVTTTVADDLGRRTVMDCLPDIKERVYPVGRLDKESEGLILLTNDGELANFLTHPAHGVEKTYRVVAEGRVPEETLRTLAEKGMRLGPVLIKPSRVELVRYDNENTVALIAVSEGINREVRRIFAALGHEVKKLLRVQVGPLQLGNLKRGATRPLTARELAQLKKGMTGIDVSEEAEMFPPGSAKGRRPTGPRGRPRPTKALRQGKPDPAAARKGPAKGKPDPATGRKGPPKGKPGPATGRKRPAKGAVVEDDWKKRTGPKARRTPAKAGESPPAKTLRPLRPSKASAPKSAAPAAKKKAPTKTARPSAISHPLAAPKPGKPRNTGKKGSRK